MAEASASADAEVPAAGGSEASAPGLAEGAQGPTAKQLGRAASGHALSD